MFNFYYTSRKVNPRALLYKMVQHDIHIQEPIYIDLNWLRKSVVSKVKCNHKIFRKTPETASHGKLNGHTQVYSMSECPLQPRMAIVHAMNIALTKGEDVVNVKTKQRSAIFTGQ